MASLSRPSRPFLRGPRELLRALHWSLRGLATAARREAAFRLELVLFIVLAPVAVWVGDSGLERAMLLGSLLLVLIVELLNSALEAAFDRFGADRHPLTAAGKDMGSAAVLVCVLLAAVTWAAILLS